MLAGACLLALLGPGTRFRWLPVLLFEFVRKPIVLAVVALPMWRSGPAAAHWFVIILAAIRWRSGTAQCETKRGTGWRRKTRNRLTSRLRGRRASTHQAAGSAARC